MKTPKEIKQSGKRAMKLVWSDGTETEYSFRLLRKQCPCADCRQQRLQKGSSKESDLLPLRVVGKEPVSQDPKLLRVEWVGNYALKLVWDDGHETGIYPFDYLLDLPEIENGND